MKSLFPLASPLFRAIVPAILLGSLVLAGSLHAAPGPEEKSQFQAAKQSFTDGLFDISDNRFTAFLKKYPESEWKAEAALLNALSLYYLGRYEASLKLIDIPEKQIPENFQDDYLFWQAENRAAQKKWDAAEKGYRDFLKRFPKDAKAGEAQLGLAWCLLKKGPPEEAKDLLAELGKDPKSEAGQKAALVLAKFQIAQQQLKEAQTGLETLLAKNPRPAVLFEGSYWLAEIYSLQKQPEQAAGMYQKITENPKAFPKEIVVKAWFGLGGAYQALQQHEKALHAFEQAFTLADAEQLKLAAFNKYLGSGKALKRLPEAVTRLQDFAKAHQDKPNAAAALFAIGLAQMDNGDAPLAINTLQALLLAYPRSRWRAPAYYELGQLYQSQKKPKEALKSLASGLEQNDDAELARKINFLTGEILLAENDTAGAIQHFDKIAGGTDSAAERALFNILLIQAQQKQLDAFLKTEARFLSQFPNSSYREKIALEKGRLQEQLGQIESARETYAKAQSAQPGAPSPLLLLRQADALYQLGKMEEALELYEKIATDFSKDALAPEAEYKAVFASRDAKKITDEQVLRALVNLVKKYPKDPLAPEIYFKIGELYYNRQDYANAHGYFEKIPQEFPQSDLADDAYYWAGKAAIGRDDLSAALVLLDKVADTAPMKPDARLLQGRILHQQGKFDKALTVFDAVLTTEKNGGRFVEATLRKGDCYFAMAGTDPGRYEAAATAYGQITNASQGGFIQRNEAAFKRAKCFQKMGRLDDALVLYLDVMNGRLAVEAQSPPPPEYLWQIKAGLEAAQMKEAAKDWHGAIAIYRKLEQMGGPNQQEFRETINKIRRDNYLYD
jgi:TolA-binding protein